MDNKNKGKNASQPDEIIAEMFLSKIKIELIYLCKYELFSIKYNNSILFLVFNEKFNSL